MVDKDVTTTILETHDDYFIAEVDNGENKWRVRVNDISKLMEKVNVQN